MPNKSSVFRTRTKATIAFSILIGVGIAITPARAAATPHATIIIPAAPSVTIINGTRAVMIALELKPQGGAWSEILAGRPLGVRQQILYGLPPGKCKDYHYEIRAMFEDGSAVTKKGQILCPPTYLVTDF